MAYSLSYSPHRAATPTALFYKKPHMYSFIEKTDLSNRFARVEHIPAYRSMLAALQLPAASRIESDQKTLAISLLYILLDHYTIEEIQARLTPPPGHFREAAKMIQEKPEGTIPAGSPAAGEQPGKKPKISKFEQYPDIPWKDLDNPQVRLADSIFSDRINCYSRLKELEAATQESIADRDRLGALVETSVRLELCFDELRQFNDKGEFLGDHPFIAQKDERERVTELLKNDPEAFFSERKNIELNITRYSSQLNGKKATEAQKEAARANLEKYQAKLRLFREVFAQVIKTAK